MSGRPVSSSDEKQVRDLVRRVVLRAAGVDASEGAEGAAGLYRRPRRLVTEDDLVGVPPGGSVPVPAGSLVSPLARQTAGERRISFEESPRSARAPAVVSENPANPARQTVAVAADHGGYELKELLKEYVRDLGFRIVDCGTDGPGSVDYPDFALAAARLVGQGKAWRALVVDGAGIGSCMAANKVPGVRAAMCYDEATAVNSREHNHANVLTLGAGMIGTSLAQRIVRVWLDTAEGGGRHERRVNKIMDIEQRFLRS